MLFSKTWSEWCLHVVDLSPKESSKAIAFLRQRYVEEVQRIKRFKQHAERMHYSQYRERFLQMALETRQHATRIGEKLVALGGSLPNVEERPSTDENSWQSLSMALDEENRSADLLPEQLLTIETEYPDIVKFMEQIAREQESQRRAIQDMLMRSDPFAQSLA